MVDIHSMLPKSAPTTTRGQRSLDKQLEQAKLTTRDDFWVRYYDELTSNGYQIPLDRFPKKYQDCSVMRQIKSRPEPPRYYPQFMDARRDADFKIVMIKLINRKVSMREVEITQLVAESEKNPNTFCVPLLEVLDPGDGECLMMVMPFLRAFNDPPFETIGEAMFFILQAFKAVEYLHQHSIAHGNCTGHNFKMDTSDMYPDGFSPVSLSLNYDGKGKAQHYSRTKRPPRYYLTDFSNAIHVTESPIHRSPSDAGQSVSELGSGSRVHEMGGLHNPFAFDIFCLGHFIKTEFVASKYGCEFLQSLVDKMTHIQPATRPTIQAALEQFERLYHSLTEARMDLRLASRKEFILTRFLKNVTHTVQVQGKHYFKDRRAASTDSVNSVGDWPATEDILGENEKQKRFRPLSVDTQPGKIKHMWRSFRLPDQSLIGSSRQSSLDERISPQSLAGSTRSLPERARSETVQSNISPGDGQPSSRVFYQRPRNYSLNNGPGRHSGQRRTASLPTNSSPSETGFYAIQPVRLLRRREESIAPQPTILYSPAFPKPQEMSPSPISQDDKQSMDPPPSSPQYAVIPSPISAGSPASSTLASRSSESPVRHTTQPDEAVSKQDSEADFGLESETQVRTEEAPTATDAGAQDKIRVPPRPPRQVKPYFGAQSNENLNGMEPGFAISDGSFPFHLNGEDPDRSSIASSAPPGKWDCHICFRSRSTKSKLIEHLLRRHPELYVCRRCGSTCTTEQKLLSHEARRRHTN